MILVCPSCDAKFKIPDGAIPAEGRTVRCAKCKNSWHAASGDIMRKQRPVVAAPPPPPRPPAHRATGFDGPIDAQVAADTAALRQSVTGPMAAAGPAASKDTLFDEDEGLNSGASPNEALRGGFDGSEEPSGDLGIGAAFDDFAPDSETVDEGDDDDRYEGDYDEDDFLAARRADQRRQGERAAQGRKRKLIAFGWFSLVVFVLAAIYFAIFPTAFMKENMKGTVNFMSAFGESMSSKGRFKPEPGEVLTKSFAEAEPYFRVFLVSSSFEERGGVQGLVLKGYVENASPKYSRSGRVPQVQAIAVNRAGREVDSWLFSAPAKILRWGRKSQFEEFRTPAPVGAVEVKLAIYEDVNPA
ncbi:MAG: hypothetical protein COB37_09695 [Kordiimonadales bacterium]|nr:MAG: hypothetical protein COB37_09695 [Kordiimonadales bacterium]